MSNPRPLVPRRAYTALEKARALALAKCRFSPASFSKRFARELAAELEMGLGITEKQAACLERQCWTYRRQLPAALRPQVQLPLLHG